MCDILKVKRKGFCCLVRRMYHMFKKKKVGVCHSRQPKASPKTTKTLPSYFADKGLYIFNGRVDRARDIRFCRMTRRGCDMKWNHRDLNVNPKWHRNNAEVKSKWTRSELGVKLKRTRIKIQVNSKWTRGGLEMKSNWTQSEIEVNSMWNRSEFKVKSKWDRREFEVKSNWPPSTQTPIQL